MNAHERPGAVRSGQERSGTIRDGNGTVRDGQGRSVVLGTSTRSRSRPEFSGGSRPTTGRDPEKKSGRDRGLRSWSGRENFFSLLF